MGHTLGAFSLELNWSEFSCESAQTHSSSGPPVLPPSVLPPSVRLSWGSRRREGRTRSGLVPGGDGRARREGERVPWAPVVPGGEPAGREARAPVPAVTALVPVAGNAEGGLLPTSVLAPSPPGPSRGAAGAGVQPVPRVHRRVGFRRPRGEMSL